MIVTAYVRGASVITDKIDGIVRYVRTDSDVHDVVDVPTEVTAGFVEYVTAPVTTWCDVGDVVGVAVDPGDVAVDPGTLV